MNNPLTSLTSKQKWIVYAVIGGVVALLALLAINTIRHQAMIGNLTLSVPSSISGTATIQVQHDGAADINLKLNPGQSTTISLLRGNARVNATAGSIKSVDVVTISGKGASLSVPSGMQRAVQQIGGHSNGCPVIVNGAVYSYMCSAEGPVLSLNSQVISGTLFDSQTFNELHAYKNGLLGFKTATSPSLLYLDPANGSIQTVQLPGAVQNLLNQGQPTLVLPQTPGDSHFALEFDIANSIYVFKDTGDSNPVLIQPKKVQLDDPYRLFSVSLTGDDHTVVYSGRNSEPGEGVTTHESASSSLPFNYIFDYDTAGTLAKTLTIPQTVTAHSMYKLVNGFYAAFEQGGEMTFYYDTGSSLKQVYTIADAASWTIVQDKLYVQASGTLYEFTPGSGGLFGLHGVFSSSGMTVSQVFATPLGLVMTAFAGSGTNTPLNVYQVLNTAQQGSKPAPIQQQRNINYKNLSALTDIGMTSDQVNDMKTHFQEYFSSAKITPSTVTFANVQAADHDPSSDSTVFTIYFSVAFDGAKPISGRVDYTDLVSTRLYFYGSDGSTPVYDSH